MQLVRELGGVAGQVLGESAGGRELGPEGEVGAQGVRTPLEERPVGGLGIFLVRRLMDEVRYERRGAWNVLTLRKRVEA